MICHKTRLETVLSECYGESHPRLPRQVGYLTHNARYFWMVWKMRLYLRKRNFCECYSIEFSLPAAYMVFDQLRPSSQLCYSLLVVAFISRVCLIKKYTIRKTNSPSQKLRCKHSILHRVPQLMGKYRRLATPVELRDRFFVIILFFSHS